MIKYKWRSLVITAISLCLNAGCSPTDSDDRVISKRVADAIALCSANLSVSTTVRAELETKLTRVMVGDQAVTLSAGIEEAARSTVFTPDTLTDANGVRSYEIYTNCLENELKRAV